MAVLVKLWVRGSETSRIRNDCHLQLRFIDRIIIIIIIIIINRILWYKSLTF